jgi:hypothetical protein
MSSDRYPDHGTEGSQEAQSGRHEDDAPAGTPSEPPDGPAEGEGKTGTEFAKAPESEFAKAPSAARPNPEPSTGFGESSLGSSTPSTYAAPAHRAAPNMLPGRERRRSGLERLVVRVIATGGVVGIGVAIGAIMAASKVQGWIIGLVVAIVSVLLSAVLWSSRQL